MWALAWCAHNLLSTRTVLYLQKLWTETNLSNKHLTWRILHVLVLNSWKCLRTPLKHIACFLPRVWWYYRAEDKRVYLLNSDLATIVCFSSFKTDEKPCLVMKTGCWLVKFGNALKASKYVCQGSVFPAKFNGRHYCTSILIVCDNQWSKNVTQADLKRIE